MTRTLYNAALEERIGAWRRAGKTVTLYEQMKSLTAIRGEDSDFSAFPANMARGALKALDHAYKAFFRRVKAGEKPGFPRFKGRDRWRTLHLGPSFTVRDGNGAWAFLHFKGCPRIRFYRHRPLPNGVEAKEARLVRDSKGWKVQFTTELPTPEAVAGADTIGIDLGIREFVAVSDGDAIPNLRLLESRLRDLRRAQRALARKKRGSGNRRRQKAAIARLHDRVARARATMHWNAAAELVAKGKHIAAEDLNVRGLARGRLARQVADVGWGTFFNRLASKAESAGLRVEKVAPAYTSQDCSACGSRVKKRLSDRNHHCVRCGLAMDRDLNAAINIRNRAVCGPAGAKPGSGRACPQANDGTPMARRAGALENAGKSS